MSIMSDIAPFRMYGNLYFVGSSRVSVHILKTEEGLVVIDTGYPDMYDQIIESMRILSFDPADICAIIHSHGHIDHTGTTLRLKEISGAKTYISRIDNDIINGTRDLSWCRELGIENPGDFDADVLIDDGDEFTFGTTKIRFKLAPGHTLGTLAIFIDLCENGEKITAAMHGGTGLNTLNDAYISANGLPSDMRQVFRKGLHDLANERVDLVLGNHPQQNDTAGKLQKVLSGEKITDPNEWQTFLKNTELGLDLLEAQA